MGHANNETDCEMANDQTQNDGMAIVILGDPRDDHAEYMAAYLETQGTRVEFLDSTTFPRQTRLWYDPGRGDGAIEFPSGGRLAFEQIRSVYWRNYAGIGGGALPDAEQAYIADNDARSLFESLLQDLPARWVNGWSAFQLHQTKPVAFARVASLGVAVPNTLLGNDPDAVLDFVDRHEHCIFKPIQGGAHTERVAVEHLTSANLATLAAAPVTIQEEVIGTDIRVFVAGEKVMACEIRTEVLDFRNDPNPDIVAIELPEAIAGASRRIACALDLVWTGIDFRRTADGRFVFLEANPSPMFLGFEQRTGLPLTESLAALLLDGDGADAS